MPRNDLSSPQTRGPAETTRWPLRVAVAWSGPINLQAGSPITYRTGVQLDLHPDGELAALQ
ncbi:hypothetical protein P3T27_007267 [Kitasatospora sp. MAA19]|uniref:hypothetical protein n=1 Tax=Kitasatospora sp. MAA19 TaxID=3035090 RepID=UPI002476C649|nr:hypothetical protein [Kitasatospora sp. MAA19]MDH6710517.1 hypothetical protein [Kitasatospora sp. MAA19]